MTDGRPGGRPPLAQTDSRLQNEHSHLAGSRPFLPCLHPLTLPRLLPTGTVTFLFTDIEGSTRLWEAQPEAMPAALARHDELMRYAIGARSGHVFKTVGDAFCAAFHTAPDALAAALEAQRALHLERWPEAVKLRVRMALHTGAVELRDHDYFGAPLNRVARLLAVGHGGQTLLSESTHDLCRDHLPPLAGVKALGEHGLKDLARREAVFQLWHPDLPSSFPPLRSQSAPVDQQTPSIAVLPFVNMSRDEENEYFADGLSRGTPQRAGEDPRAARGVAHLGVQLQGQGRRPPDDRAEAQRRDDPRGQRAQGGQPGAHHRAADRGGRPTRTCGRRPTTASSTTSSPCRTTSRSRW